MPHLVLLGDSVFDNGAYTAGGPDVISQVRETMPAGWSATLVAVDGSQAREVVKQLARVPDDATHLVLSVGGNDALMEVDLLDAPVKSSADALRLIAATVRLRVAILRRGRCLPRPRPAACALHDLPR